jgi:hypothetical protein
MGQNVRTSKDKQYLLRIASDLLRQVIQLEKLREAVQLAEAAQALQRSKALRRRRINPKVIDPFAGTQLSA